MNDTNKDQCCRGITCKSHSARSERAELYRICPSKLSKRELEDLYYALLENNLDLKRTINGQMEKIKVLSTKVHRITTAQRNCSGKEQMCCANAKAIICEQKESIADLKKANERMIERIKLLNMKLCSAKQFLKCPNQSTSRCVNRCVTAGPTTTSLKNCSSTVINTKGSDSNLKSVAVSCDNFEKDEMCTRSVETETSDQEKEDPDKPCDQNRCQTVMKELKQKIVNLQEELSNGHEEYSTRISRLEREMSEVRDDNVRVRSEHALAVEGLRARDQRANDLAAKLRGAEAHYSELALELSLERKRVSELEMRIRAENMSCKAVKRIHEHLGNIDAIKEEMDTEKTPACHQDVNRLNKMQATKESVKDPAQPGPSSSPNNTTTTRWDASTPLSDMPSHSRRMKVPFPGNILDGSKTIKYSDDSGYADSIKIDDMNEVKNKFNQELMNRISHMQNRLDTLNNSTTEISNDREIKLNDKPSDTTIKQFEIAEEETSKIKLYNESSDTIIQQYDAQKKIKHPTSISIEPKLNYEDITTTDHQIKLYNESSDTIIQQYDAQKIVKDYPSESECRINRPGKFAYREEKSLDDQFSAEYYENIVHPYVEQKDGMEPTAVANDPMKSTVDPNYLDEKFMNEIENSSKVSTHMSAQQSVKNLSFDNDDVQGANKKISAAVKNWQYPTEESSSKTTGQVKCTIDVAQREDFNSALSVLINNKDAIKAIRTSCTKKDDCHNSYQIPGPIPGLENNKNEKISLGQIFVEGINNRKNLDAKLNNDVVNSINTVVRNSMSMQRHPPDFDNIVNGEMLEFKILDNLDGTAKTDMVPIYNTENIKQNVDVVCPNNAQKKTKEKTLSFEDDEKKYLKNTLKKQSGASSQTVMVDHKESVIIDPSNLMYKHEEVQASDDKTKESNNVSELSIPALCVKAVEKIKTRKDSSTFPDGQYQVSLGPMQFALKKEDSQLEQSQINQTTLQREIDQTDVEKEGVDICEATTTVCRCRATRRDVAVFRTCSGTLRFRTTATGVTMFRRCGCNPDRMIRPECGIQTDQSEPQPEQNVHSMSQSPGQTYTLNPNENKCTRATSPENTEFEISSLADLPSDKDGKSPRGSLSPGEEKATVTYSDSYSAPTTTDYGSLSEGELPGVKRNQPTKPASKGKNTLQSAPAEIPSSQKMEAALQAISEELARCRQLLMSQTSAQEQSKSDSKDVSTSVEIANERLALKKAPASPRIGDTVVPQCVFTLHIGTVVLSDEAVMNSCNTTLVLMWKFFDQNVAMTRMRTGRVILFDFSTEYEVKLTDDFFNYLKYEDMPIIVCEIDKQDEPFASCALPLRRALLNTNKRTDMSLALMAGPQMKRARRATDDLDAGDEMGVVDLWCMLRADTSAGSPALSHLLARMCSSQQPDGMVKKASGKDNFSQPSRDTPRDYSQGKLPSSQQPDIGDQTIPSKDYNSQTSLNMTPQNNYLGSTGIHFSPSEVRPSPVQHKPNNQISELKEKGPVGFHNDKWPPAPTHIRSTEDMKKALQRNVFDKNHSSKSKLITTKMEDRGVMRHSQKTKWFDRKDYEDDEAQDHSVSIKETKRNSKDLQGLRYTKDDGSEENFSKKNDSTNKTPKSVTIVPKPEKSSRCEVRQKGRINEYKEEKYSEDDIIGEYDDRSGTQSLTIKILWLALNEECEAMVNPKVQRLYVAYTFLGRSGAELETPVSLPKPKHYVDKCCFNFSKTFQLHDCDLPLLGHMARCRSSNRMSGDPRDCVVFTVISEPPEDPLGLDSCEDIGYAQLYLGDVVAYSAGSGEYTEVVPVRAAAGDVVGVLAVRLSGLHVVRRCLAHEHRDLAPYWYSTTLYDRSAAY